MTTLPWGMLGGCVRLETSFVGKVAALTSEQPRVSFVLPKSPISLLSLPFFSVSSLVSYILPAISPNLGHFSSSRHTVCALTALLHAGKVYYEVTMTDEGLCRVGWSSRDGAHRFCIRLPSMFIPAPITHRLLPQAPLSLGLTSWGLALGALARNRAARNSRTTGRRLGSMTSLGACSTGRQTASASGRANRTHDGCPCFSATALLTPNRLQQERAAAGLGIPPASSTAEGAAVCSLHR